jgi:enoyl-CoA hydratase/carnithine racemase
MQAPLDYAQEGAIVTLTLNAPDIRNAISGTEMIDALEAACDRMNADMSVGAAILTGAGTAFSSGGNVKKMRWRRLGGGLGGGCRRRRGATTSSASSASRSLSSAWKYR